MNSSVKFNEYHYLSWDYNDARLIFHSDCYEYHCEITKNCSKYETKYIPTTYILTSDYIFFNDIVSGTTCRLNHNRQQKGCISYYANHI